MAFVHVNGIDVHYTIDGSQGPWITLSHSLACNLSAWDAQVELLKNNFRVLRFDTRGHGLSSAPEGPYTLEQLADDVLYSLPSFFVGTVLLRIFTEGDPLSIFPTGDFETLSAGPMTTAERLGDVAWHLVLPVAMKLVLPVAQHLGPPAVHRPQRNLRPACMRGAMRA